MYDDFVLKHPNICKVYRKILKEMNISLRQPKSDICEECSSLKNILENAGDDIIQNQFDSHRTKAAKANVEYKKDSNEAAAASATNKRIYSMDLRKVIILPIQYNLIYLETNPSQRQLLCFDIVYFIFLKGNPMQNHYFTCRTICITTYPLQITLKTILEVIANQL
ncbi:unnamed protein product [Psylliodes chrysocephalus]|uniref:Uncharacterized protein n=1 Tax=Psylliodes chrysocephalus TaxID=3402493 RepID=A0A9P0CMG3_9CUCU|nr:unnamed protein product [Psylliodes chrysocephala]